MRQLTVRGFDAALERHLREVARREGESLNRAALRLMRRGARLGDEGGGAGAIGETLDPFFGTWTAEEAQELEAAVAIFEQIDAEMWR